MHMHLCLVVITLLLIQLNTPWSDEKVYGLFQDEGITFSDYQNGFIDPHGNLLSINQRYQDLNGDGIAELLVEASGSYYLWGSTEAACFVLNLKGKTLIEVVGLELSLIPSVNNGYQDICISGKRGSSIYKWNDKKYKISSD